MTPAHTEPNPFALMMEPEVIFAKLAASDRLARLHSRICRPLDKAVAVPGEGEPDEIGGEEIDELTSRFD